MTEQQDNLGIVWGIEAIAEVLGCSKSRCKYLVGQGIIPAKRVGRHVCITRKQLEALFEEGAA